MRDYFGSALLTDLYQLTMAYGYWKHGLADTQAAFHLHFRTPPFEGGYAIACGLEPVMAFLNAFSFEEADLQYLSTLRGNDEQPLFEVAFLEYLRSLSFSCNVYGIPEGTPVFGMEPLLRVEGPLLQCQLLETPLLNLINFPTLIATKAARIYEAAQGAPVLEFGLRRAQGVDGGLAASRAAYIGGCAATSNVLAGREYDIPVKGTHAHSWVMAFAEEQAAFQAYAQALPNNCIFLVDTYDSLGGTDRAISVATQLRAEGHEMVGIRLDSGDLNDLSRQARKKLDGAGFPEAKIVASNDLDEFRIEHLQQRGSQIDIWGVGTRLVTAFDQPALGGVYKLSAIQNEAGEWQDRIKLSEQEIKVSLPGRQTLWRYRREDLFVADVIASEEQAPHDLAQVESFTGMKISLEGCSVEPVMVPVFERGRQVYLPPDIHASRSRTLEMLPLLPVGVRRFAGAASFPVGLEPGLAARKKAAIRAAKAQKD
jgi:nicotinate phosphoribosyltransferase